MQLLGVLRLALTSLNRYQDALEACDEVISIDSEQALHQSSKGLVFAELQRWDGAVRCFQKAVELDPVDQNLLCHLAFGFLMMDDFKSVLEVSEKSLLLDPSHERSLNYKAEALLELERYIAIESGLLSSSWTNR
jgi:tetratricopeptide (TPR) repeat protein